MEVNGSFKPASLPQGNSPLYSIEYNTGWAPEAVWIIGDEKIIVLLPGIGP
jgi:hypothetical protein